MFDQPPLTAKEVFGRGCVEGLAMIFFAFLLSLVPMLPSRYRLYLSPSGSLGQGPSVFFGWALFGTIGCTALLFKKDERTATYRAGVLASYALFLAAIVIICAHTR